MNLAERLAQFKLQQIEENKIYSRNHRVLIVDGTNTYLRAFAATPTLNDNGEHVGGITGFLYSVGSIIRQFRPTRCIIVFDGKGGSQRRRAIYPEYKQNRRTMVRLNRTYDFQTIEEEKDSQLKQLLILLTILRTLPVTLITQDNVEADDVIAYITQIVRDRNGSSIITSTDKDFLQLVSDNNVSIWNPIKKKTYTTTALVAEYNIHPINFLLYRAIEGDASDNIEGISGVGRKYLCRFVPEMASETKITIDMLRTICEQKKSKITNKIINGIDIINRNIQLMSLDDQMMSGHAKMSVLNRFDDTVCSLNRKNFFHTLSEQRLLGGFTNTDRWLTDTFSQFHTYLTD